MKEYPQLGSKDTRSGFGIGLLEAGKRNDKRSGEYKKRV